MLQMSKAWEAYQELSISRKDFTRGKGHFLGKEINEQLLTSLLLPLQCKCQQLWPCGPSFLFLPSITFHSSARWPCNSLVTEGFSHFPLAGGQKVKLSSELRLPRITLSLSNWSHENVASIVCFPRAVTLGIWKRQANYALANPCFSTCAGGR